jgi:hypothetical protein
VKAIESVLADDYRARHIRLRAEPDGPIVQVDLGGSQLPDQALRRQLREIARQLVGEDTGVRLTFRYEALVDRESVETDAAPAEIRVFQKPIGP